MSLTTGVHEAPRYDPASAMSQAAASGHADGPHEGTLGIADGGLAHGLDGHPGGPPEGGSQAPGAHRVLTPAVERVIEWHRRRLGVQ